MAAEMGWDKGVNIPKGAEKFKIRGAAREAEAKADKAAQDDASQRPASPGTDDMEGLAVGNSPDVAMEEEGGLEATWE